MTKVKFNLEHYRNFVFKAAFYKAQAAVQAKKQK